MNKRLMLLAVALIAIALPAGAVERGAAKRRPSIADCLVIVDEAEVAKASFSIEYIATLEDVADCLKQATGRGRYVHRDLTERKD